MNRSRYPTTHPVRELFRNVALAVFIGPVGAMVLDSWWFTQ